MSAEQFLKSHQMEGRQLDKLLRLQAHLRDSHRALKQAGDPRAPDMLAEAARLQDIILAQYQAMEVMRKRLQRYIDRLPDPKERAVLTLLYIRQFTMQETAHVMDFTPRHCSRIHRRALEHLEAFKL